MTPSPDLNPRQKQVLTAIVDHYIVKAEPVSSKVLSQSAILRASSATLRNTMSELEDLGFVEQPHASAGRLPTDRGYRAYVDDLMHPELLRDEDRRAIDAAPGIGESAEARLAGMAKVLADMTQLLGIVIPPPDEGSTFRSLSLVPVDEGKTVLVMTRSDSESNSLLVEARPESPTLLHLESLARRLNQELRGQPVAALNRHLQFSQKTPISLEEKDACDLLNRSILKLSRSKVTEEIFLFGAKNLLNRPDLLKIEDISSVLELLDSKVTLVHFLRQRELDEGVHVTMGEERDGEGRLFRAFSLVTSAFSLNGGQAKGLLGVLGPKRIPYARLVPVVDYAARAMSFNGNTGNGES